MILIFLYVGQSVSWLTSLLKKDKYRDISSSGWYISLRFLETFMGWGFQINLKFLSVCVQLNKLFNIFGSGLGIFLESSSNSPRVFVNYFKYSCISSMSVSLLVGLLHYWKQANIGISPVLEWISFLNIFETFLGCFYTISQN